MLSNALAFAFAATLVSGSAFSQSTQSGQEPLPAPLFVITGGYSSCTDDGNGGWSTFGSNFTSQGVQLINELHEYYSSPAVNWRGMTEPGIRWVFTCFTKTSQLFVQSNLDGGIVDLGESWELNPVIARIEKLSSDYTRPIFFIGHSHGGWLAMRLVEALRKPIAHGYLATLDPISFTECNASTFADAILGFNWSTLAPCRQAPGDFTSTSIQTIRRNLAGKPWKHYWQNHFPALHSGEIAGGPDFSLDMTSFFSMWGGSAMSVSAHTRIAYLSSIWYALKTSFQVAYGEQ